MMHHPAMLSWMQVLSELFRARQLCLLEQAELTVAELCAIMQSPQSTVSRHLKVLADDGWLESRRDGTSRFYRFRREDLEDVRQQLWTLVRSETESLACCQLDVQRMEKVLAEREARSQAFFASAAEHWDQTRLELFGRQIDQWLLSAMIAPQQTIGELGCGTAPLAAMVAPFAERVIAVDNSTAMLKAARTRTKAYKNVDVRRGELTAMPLEDGELTTGVLALVMAYVSEPVSVLEEAYRVLGRKGRLIVIDMVQHDRTSYQQEMGHQWLGFEQKTMVGWCRTAGFKRSSWTPLPVDSEAKGPGLFCMVAEKG